MVARRACRSRSRSRWRTSSRSSIHFTLNRQWVFAADAGYALHFSPPGRALPGSRPPSRTPCTADRGRGPAGRPRHPGARGLLPGDGGHGRASPSSLLHLWVFRAAPDAAPREPAARLGRRPVPQRGGQRPPALRAPARDARGGRGRLRDHLQPRPLHRRDRGPHPRDPAARPAGQDAPPLAALRPAGGDPGGHPHGRRRRLRGHRLRPAGPAGADRRDDRALVAGLRRGLRAATLARRRDPAEADRRRARLPRHPPRRRGRDPARTPATSA